MKAPVCVLTIAGSDSGGGAGIQADARTIHALGAYALTAITAVTAQNTRGVTAWQSVSASLIRQQIAAVAADFSIAAIKTGLLPGGAAIRSVAAALSRLREIPLIVDPVIGSTSGTRFLSSAALAVLRRELLPRATLVTPNWAEAAALSGRAVRNFTGAEAAARAMIDRGCRAVLVKGGHGPGNFCRDCLVTREGAVRWFGHRRITTRNTHGTGCVLSAAIATGLARGQSLERAIEAAQEFLRAGLQAGRKQRLGRGHGPSFIGSW